jgi:hypothetical protein
VSAPGVFPTAPGTDDPLEHTHNTNPDGNLPSRRKGSTLNPQVLAMLGMGATLMLAILLVLFW